MDGGGRLRSLGEDGLTALLERRPEAAAVAIDCESQTGALTRRVIDSAALSGGSLTAWCRLRQDERNFPAGRLRGVTIGAAE